MSFPMEISDKLAVRSREQSHQNMTRIWTHSSFCNELSLQLYEFGWRRFIGFIFVGGSSLDSLLEESGLCTQQQTFIVPCLQE